MAVSKYTGGTLASSGAGAGLTALGPTLAADVREAEAVTLGLSGTFVGTWQAQVSLDGTNWCNFGTALTAPGTVVIAASTGAPAACAQVRWNCTAFTSGTAVATYGKRDEG